MGEVQEFPVSGGAVRIGDAVEVNYRNEGTWYLAMFNGIDKRWARPAALFEDNFYEVEYADVPGKFLGKIKGKHIRSPSYGSISLDKMKVKTEVGGHNLKCEWHPKLEKMMWFVEDPIQKCRIRQDSAFNKEWTQFAGTKMREQIDQMKRDVNINMPDEIKKLEYEL